MSNVKKFFLKLFGTLLLLLLVAGGIYYAWGNMTYSDGSRAGYLLKISKKGYIFKTYEGELNLGGLGNGDVTALLTERIWKFTVSDAAVYSQLQNYEGKQVSLKYKQKNHAFFWQGDTDYFVYAAEPVEQNNHQ